MTDRSTDDDLIAESLELPSVCHAIDDPILRRTLKALAHALEHSHYGASLWAKFRPRPPSPRTRH